MAKGGMRCISVTGDIPHLDGYWEEADVFPVPHAWDAGQQEYERIVNLSPDNDALTLFLQFACQLFELRVHGIWTL